MKELKEEDLETYRLALMNSSDGKGVILGLMHQSETDTGRFAHLTWEAAIELADRIYAKHKKHLED